MNTRQPRQKFVVVVPIPGSIEMRVYGPFGSFKVAEGFAIANGGSVEPLIPIDKYGQVRGG